MMLRLGGLAAMVSAVVFGAAAIALTGWGWPDPGVDPGVSPGAGNSWLVVSVMPGGPAWSHGVRAQQEVVELNSPADPMDWRLITRDGSTLHATSYRAVLEAARGALVPGLIGLVAAAASWMAIRRLPAAVGLAVVSLAISSQILPLTGAELLSAAAVAAGPAGLAVWLGAWGPGGRRARIVSAGFVTAVAAGWLAARFALPSVFDTADIAVDATMAAGVAVTLVSLADWRRWRGRLLSLESGRVADVVAAVAVLATSVFVALILEGPLFLLVALGLGVVILYPRLRRSLAGVIDQILLGDVRGRASLAAVESERGRIARDLHDEPLQEIAAAIRRLDQKPGTELEADLLRQAAGHIRRVTTELRPPVLDDLGLAAAISFIADQAAVSAPGIKVESSITPEDPLPNRPPEEIELALFRIVQEAVDNAARHSEASTIWITADITPTAIVATVEDDGIGLSRTAAREAMRHGHVGLVSMTQRAELVGASLRISPAQPRGTRVETVWRAQA